MAGLGGEPEVTVVIPSYNRPHLLGRAVRGLLQNRASVTFEVVVVDDGSLDAAAVDAAVREVDSTGHIVRLVRKANGGPASARSYGVEASSARLLLFVDDDCVVTTGCIDTLVGAHRASQSEELLAVMGRAVWDPANRTNPLMELAVRGAQFDYDGITDPERVPFGLFYTACAMISRQTYDAVGGFDTSLPPYYEDTEFAYRLVTLGGRIAYRADAVVLHDHHLELRPYLERQRRAGRAAVEVVERHPQLFEALGLDGIADVGAREQFYVALMRYAWIIGVEEGLGAPTRPEDLPGEHLRSVLEEWLPAWAVTAASERRAWQARAEAMAAAVAERDARLADVVQAKDARIAALEVELGRLHRFPPVQVARAIAGWLRRAR